jgi:hypothetical protein
MSKTTEGLSEETVARDRKYLLRSLGILLEGDQYTVFREKLPTVTGKIFFHFLSFDVVQINTRLRIKTNDDYDMEHMAVTKN